MSEEQEEVCRKVRSMVMSLIKKGADPSDVSFSLSLVATELGLEVTDGSISVFPVVMAGITHAVANAVDESADTQETNQDDTPIGVTVH
tara:strand:+ start:452 stop:718 length:267 start_codon:yes stop_codon:yes gene_type:complete